MKTKTAILLTTMIAVAAITAGIVSAISFSTPVQGQATHVQVGTCTGPDKACGNTVITPSGNANTQGQVHNTGIVQPNGATVFPTMCGVQPTGESCGMGVFTPSGNVNTYVHNTTNTK